MRLPTIFHGIRYTNQSRKTKLVVKLLLPLPRINLTIILGEEKRMVCKFQVGCKRVEIMLSTDLLTACNVTGYDTQKHGIRYTHVTGYDTPARDTTHPFHGIRHTNVTGYDTPVSRDTVHWNNH
jgi:hypothetical protein